jgi:hypothetical protein
MLATWGDAVQGLTLAVGLLAVVACIDYLLYRAVRRLELLVKVLVAMAATLISLFGLALALLVGALGVLVIGCPPDATECF